MSERAFSAVVEYTDAQRDQWFTDVGAPSTLSTVDFNGLSDSTPVANQWEHLGIHFSGFIVTRGFDDFLYPNDGWGARGEPDINITFDEPMQWIAADYPGDVVIQLFYNNQLFHTYQNPLMGGVGRFSGLVSDQPFDRVRIYDPLDDLVFLDDLYFGPPIPTPPTLLVVLVGGFMSRRRRR